MPPQSRVQSCLLLTSCLFLQVAGGPSPTPTGQHVLDVDSYLDSSVLDSSFLAFPGLRAEVRAPQGALPGLAGSHCLWGAQGLRLCLYFSIGFCWTNEK